MEYLEKVLGIKTYYNEIDLSSLPHYLLSRYEIKEVRLNQIDTIMMKSKEELDSISLVRKQIDKVQQITQLPVVLVLSQIAFHQRESLLKYHIPFIVEGKQIYLPFMATYLQENYSQQKTYKNKFLPSTQLLFIYYICSQSSELELSKAAVDLELTPMSVSRAAKQLEALNCMQSYTRGVHKVIYSKLSKQELFEQCRQYLQNPVKRKIYVNKNEIQNDLQISGYSALSYYSLMNDSNIQYYADYSISKYKEVNNQLVDYETQVCIEYYRYDSRKLTKGKYVDILSLALSLEDEEDERVQKEVEEMLVELWRSINGQRHQQI